MKKITITIPKEKIGFFKVSYNGPSAKRTKPLLAYNWAKKKIDLTVNRGEKTSIVIKMGKDTINESLPSKNKKYLLWLTLAFLEDYLPKEFYKSKEKLYIGSQP
jgi:hypothetical protein